MASDEKTLELIDEIYTAGFGEVPWEQPMAKLRELANATAVTIHVDSPAEGASVVLANVGINPEDVPRYESYYVTRNPWMLRAATQCTAGQLLFGEQFVPRRELLKTEYHSGFLKPNGIVKAQSLCLHQRADLVAVLSILRSANQPDHGTDDIELARRLMPHLQRAALANYRLSRFNSQKWLAESALDALPSGAIVLDQAGRIALMNQAARTILARRNAVRDQDGRLRFADGEAQRRLDALEVAASRELDGIAFHARKSVGDGVYEVVIIPMPQTETARTIMGGLEHRRGHLVLITDPDDASPRLHLHLRQLYELTPAEIEITGLLVDGKTLPEIGERRQTTLNTVKAQVRSIYQKVDVSSRSKLIRRVTSLQVGAAHYNDPERDRAWLRQFVNPGHHR